MAYIPPQDFSPPPQNTKRICRHCGYNLQGIPVSANCPECGERSVVSNTSGVKKDIPLSQMPESFVRRLALCCTATIIVFPAIAARMFLPAAQITTPGFALVVDLLIAVIWIVGVMLLTNPINNQEAARYGLGKNGILRRIARWCSFGSLGVVIGIHAPQTILLVASLVVLAIGLICLFLLLAEIADWVRDTTAKKLLEYAAWGAPFLFILSQILILFIPPIVSIAIGLFGTVLLLQGILGMMMLTSSVLKAVTHAREFQDYQERRVKKKDSTRFPHPK
ncbi:MAG: hypothetical protein QF718_08055 [Phycisphaerales bacterium]|jgi:hypothetical protein|nr:hypothetical protein [Phycisphaerales bacterium]